MLTLNRINRTCKYAVAGLAFCLALTAATATEAQQSPALQQDSDAMQDFNDEDLKKFANAAGKMVVIQQETEQKMIEAIEEEELEVNKFNEIMMAQQNPQAAPPEATEEDLEKFDKAVVKLMAIQTEGQEEMTEAIEEEGLEPQTYEQILLAYQSNPDVKAKIDSFIQE